LGPACRLYFSAELPGSKVVLTGGDSRVTWTAVVDLGKGVVERRAPNLQPSIAFGFVSPWVDPRSGDPAPRLISAIEGGHTLVAWDPLTGEKKTIANRWMGGWNRTYVPVTLTRRRR